MKINEQKSPALSLSKEQGQSKTVLPLCFALFSQKEPHQVQIASCNITVATGEAYTITLQPAACGMYSPTPRYCFAPNSSSLKHKLSVTFFRWNAFISYYV